MASITINASDGSGKLATMGYCLGGRLAFMMAEQSDADANLSCYGVGLDGLLGEPDKISKPLMVHIADKDEYFPAEGRGRGRGRDKGPQAHCHLCLSQCRPRIRSGQRRSLGWALGHDRQRPQCGDAGVSTRVDHDYALRHLR